MCIILVIKTSVQEELRENMINTFMVKKKGHRQDQPVQLPTNNSCVSIK